MPSYDIPTRVADLPVIPDEVARDLLAALCLDAADGRGHWALLGVRRILYTLEDREGFFRVDRAGFRRSMSKIRSLADLLHRELEGVPLDVGIWLQRFGFDSRFTDMLLQEGDGKTASPGADLALLKGLLRDLAAAIPQGDPPRGTPGPRDGDAQQEVRRELCLLFDATHAVPPAPKPRGSKLEFIKAALRWFDRTVSARTLQNSLGSEFLAIRVPLGIEGDALEERLAADLPFVFGRGFRFRLSDPQANADAP